MDTKIDSIIVDVQNQEMTFTVGEHDIAFIVNVVTNVKKGVTVWKYTTEEKTEYYPYFEFSKDVIRMVRYKKKD